MCGIAGVYHFSKDQHVDQESLRKMTLVLQHRGPDHHGIWCDQNIGFGHQRLSILDLSAKAHQPMSNPSQTIWITYNGEFYNYREWKSFLEKKGYSFRTHCDTEVILALYEEFGIDCLTKINGMFAFAIWDQGNNTLYLARDRIGIKPLVYYFCPTFIAFASEIKALEVHPQVPKALNQNALFQYFSFMSIPFPMTIYHHIFKLEPGHFAKIKNRHLEKKSYWDLKPTNHHGPSFSLKDYQMGLMEKLNHSVQRRLIADVPVGTFLSGGVDSSAVTLLCQKHQKHPIHSFCMSFKANPKENEYDFAREIAALSQIHLHEVNEDFLSEAFFKKWIKTLGEPFSVASALGVYQLAKETRKSIKVVLTGDGADEIFGGYPWRHSHFRRRTDFLRTILGPFLKFFRQKFKFNYPSSDPTFRRKLSTLVLTDAEAYLDLMYCFSPFYMNQYFSSSFISHQGIHSFDFLKEYYDRFDGVDTLFQKLYLDLKTSLVNEMLTKVDLMTMAHGLEARVPFLDHELVEWAFQVPSELKLNGQEGKLILKQALEPLIPKHILYRRKHGFNVPLDSLFRNEWRPILLDTIHSQSFRERGWYHMPSIHHLVDEHLQKKRDYGDRLFNLLVLEYWMNEKSDPK